MVSTHHCGLAQFEKDFNTHMNKIVGGLASISTTTLILLHILPFPVMIFFTEDILLTPRSFDKTNLEPSTHPLPSTRTFSKSIQLQEEAFRIDLFPDRRPFLTEFASETSESPESACVESESEKCLI